MKVLLFVFSFCMTFSVFSQSKITWTYTYNEQTKTIEMKAQLAEGWHLYSQHIANDVGPVPTSFSFEENKSVKFIGRVSEPEAIQMYDENFEAMLDFFEDEVIFRQRISVKKSSVVDGTVTYMMCNKTQCLPPVDEKFTIQIIVN
jgi:hypothetical protein